MRLRWSAAILVLAAGLLCPGRAALADGYAETERRLKTAGIEPELRDEIHEAIRRGVARLRELQAENGGFRKRAGETALAGLAMRHAAIPSGVEGGRRAIGWIRRFGATEARRQTYVSGVTAMLLDADEAEPALLEGIHDALAAGMRGSAGFWGYASRGSQGGLPNLSTSQFGCLGLWAAERSGVSAAHEAWERHLRALVRVQLSDGSWSYYLGGSGGWQVKPYVSSYPTGTYMGLAGLVLAREALGEVLPEDPELWARTVVAQHRGEAALRRHARWTLEAPEGASYRTFWPYYSLYALEKVCVFLDVEELSGLGWYAVGARLLVDAQRKDGGWAGPLGDLEAHGFVRRLVQADAPIQTSFALLFLLRASESYRPITPRPVSAAPVTTPGDRPPAPPVEIPPRTLPVATAAAALERLAEEIAQERIRSPRTALDALRFVRRTYPTYREGNEALSPTHDAWCTRAERDLPGRRDPLPVVTRPRCGTFRLAIALEALRTLGLMDTRVALRLRRVVETLAPDSKLPAPAQVAWYGSAFEALRRLDAPGLGEWIRTRMLSAAPADWPRTSAAITALGGLPHESAESRYATARAVIEGLADLRSQSPAEARTHSLMIEASLLFRRLVARKGLAGFPRSPAQDVKADWEALAPFFRRHARPTAPAWNPER